MINKPKVGDRVKFLLPNSRLYATVGTIVSLDGEYIDVDVRWKGANYISERYRHELERITDDEYFLELI